jgi:sirohydrochlorin ferrochelatase
MVESALLLIAHGSRHPAANDDLHHAVEELKKRGQRVVEAAFLELASPTIEEGAETCVGQGAEQVVLVPFFLSAGVHVQRDLTAAHEKLSARFPAVRFVLAEPFGRHPLLLEIVLERVEQALLPTSESPPD